MYSEIQAHQEGFNSTSIPRAIKGNLEKQNLKKVSWSQDSIIFNDTEKSIHVEFYLGGEDVLSYTLNITTATRTYSVRADWIKFDVKLTSTFTLNFTSYFAPSISAWPRINNYTINGNKHTAFFYNSTVGSAPFDASCYFILPLKATNIRAVGDTLTFETPTILEDRLIDSPILILGGIVVVIIVANIYRKIRK